MEKHIENSSHFSSYHLLKLYFGLLELYFGLSLFLNMLERHVPFHWSPAWGALMFSLAPRTDARLPPTLRCPISWALRWGHLGVTRLVLGSVVSLPMALGLLDHAPQNGPTLDPPALGPPSLTFFALPWDQDHHHWWHPNILLSRPSLALELSSGSSPTSPAPPPSSEIFSGFMTCLPSSGGQ